MGTVETLKAEVIASNEEAERASKELESMRTRAFQENAQEAYLRERELREAQAELEQCRIDRDEWERKALQERVAADEGKAALEEAMRDLEIEREAREQEADALQSEREKASNLQSVLEDFQAGEYLSEVEGVYSVRPSKGPRATTSCQGVRVAIGAGHTIVSRIQASSVDCRGKLNNALSVYNVRPQSTASTGRILNELYSNPRTREGSEREESFDWEAAT